MCAGPGGGKGKREISATVTVVSFPVGSLGPKLGPSAKAARALTSEPSLQQFLGFCFEPT